LPAGRPIVLLSFGGLGFRGIDAVRLAELDEFLFVGTEPLAKAGAEPRLPRAQRARLHDAATIV